MYSPSLADSHGGVLLDRVGEGAADTLGATVEDSGVYRRRFVVDVAQGLLDNVGVVAGFRLVDCVGLPGDVKGGPVGWSCCRYGISGGLRSR